MNRRLWIISNFVLLIWASSAYAEVVRLQPDFTFRRVTVPSGGAGSRINVQIDPNAPRIEPVYADEPEPEEVNVPVAVPPGSAAEWFWRGVSGGIAGSSPARLQMALQQINNAPEGEDVRTPRLQSLQNIASAHGPAILKETVGTNVSPALVIAVISVESAGRTDAVSTAGATGLMQLMPATAERFGVSDRTNAAENIKGGVAYLDWLLTEFGNDPVLVLAGYNAGEGNVQRYEGVPPFAETREYVPKVLAAWQVAKGLCRTPPELITDGCVFNVSGT
ncbi:lytic transglycosylase domain-containing protein [Loktanella sp. S4079]|uniref:lytic transglycosylase domain-containing protein n=1 Tax=Loktanella sp. S4079 TaxID=579483 RepID=UPI0005FA278D|nr:lytic transglycosylase domain-containing protein [Loktanella sp. S4079]KJZ18256.1 lytic murein transglycosylase [Loktanella sp. S4079]